MICSNRISEERKPFLSVHITRPSPNSYGTAPEGFKKRNHSKIPSHDWSTTQYSCTFSHSNGYNLEGHRSQSSHRGLDEQQLNGGVHVAWLPDTFCTKKPISLSSRWKMEVTEATNEIWKWMCFQKSRIFSNFLFKIRQCPRRWSVFPWVWSNLNGIHGNNWFRTCNAAPHVLLVVSNHSKDTSNID